MRVCPNCLFVDPAIWRAGIACREIDFCNLEDLQQLNVKLAWKILREQKKYGTRNFVEDGIYVYHLTKGMFVERQAIMENPTYRKQWKIHREASPHKDRRGYVQCLHKPLSKGQKTLFPRMKKRKRRLK